MILSVIFILSAITLGFFIAKKLGILQTFEEKLFAGIALGIGAACWISYAADYIFQQNGIWISFSILLASSIFLLWKNAYGKKLKIEFDKGFWLRLALCFIVLILVFASGAPRVTEDGSIKITLVFWPDLHHHYASINNFAEHVNIPAENPYFAGDEFKYSYLIDLHSASLMKLGMQREIAFWLPQLLLLFSLFALIYFFAFRLTKSKNAAFLAVVLLFFAAGFSYVQVFNDMEKHDSFTDWITHMDTDYGNLLWHSQDVWQAQFLKGYLIPQRANDLGYPLAVIVFMLLLEAISNPKKRKELFLYAGVITGFMPLIREFSFLAIGIVSAFLFVMFFDKKWLWFIIPAVLISIPQIMPMLQLTGESEMIKWSVGWRSGSQNPVDIFAFWLANLNLPFVLAILGFFLLPKTEKKYYLAFVPIFILVNLLQFTPDNYNNMKLANIWQIPTYALAGLFLARAWDFAPKKKHLQTAARVLVIAAVLVSVTTGILSIAKSFQQDYTVYSANDVLFANWVNANTDKNG
ncbi:MAG: hypothetical protein V1811_02155, partial [Candidatus Micrarchaeota archaeon]